MNVQVIAWKNDVTLVKFLTDRVCPYAVVRNFDKTDNTWSHAIGYFRDWKDAENLFMEKIEEQ